MGCFNSWSWWWGRGGGGYKPSCPVQRQACLYFAMNKIKGWAKSPWRRHSDLASLFNPWQDLMKSCLLALGCLILTSSGNTVGRMLGQLFGDLQETAEPWLSGQLASSSFSLLKFYPDSLLSLLSPVHQYLPSPSAFYGFLNIAGGSREVERTWSSHKQIVGLGSGEA